MNNELKRIRDVERIFEAGNTEVATKADLAKIIEEPCLAVCEDLYDKNILTYWSSSNKDNPNKSFVLIRYESLDEANKAIADSLVMEGKATEDNVHESGNGQGKNYGKGICIGIDSNSDMLVSKVSSQLRALASSFEHQDILYNMYTPEYLAGQHPFHGTKKVFGFPDLRTAICGEEYTDNYKPYREKIFDDVRIGMVKNRMMALLLLIWSK